MAAAASQPLVEFVGSRQSPGCQRLGPWTLNSGPFPPPALPGFKSPTNPSATLTRHGLSLAGVRLRGTPPRHEGLPVLRWISCAGMLPPIPRRDRWVGSLMGRHIPAGLLLTSDGGLPQVSDGSAPTTRFSGPHRKFTCVAAYLLAGLQNGPLDRRLRRLCYLPRRSDCYRLERPRCRAGLIPAEDPHLFTAHAGPFSSPGRAGVSGRPQAFRAHLEAR
jgi:hypothetical protein